MARDPARLAVAAAMVAFVASTSAGAQTAATGRPDPMAQAYLFGAGFKDSDLSQDKPGGMMFLPGRGLVR